MSKEREARVVARNMGCAYLPAFSPAGILTFIWPPFLAISDVVAHFPGSRGAPPSSYLPFSKILTKELAVGGFGDR
jgi:hypothetical protein